jgi:hypothetical protein
MRSAGDDNESSCAYKLDWLPRHLGPNVKLIVSVAAGGSELSSHLMLNKLTSRYTSVKSYIELAERLDASQADYIVRKYLEEASNVLEERRLEAAQHDALLALVNAAPVSPLHLRLLSAEFREWKSWQQQGDENDAIPLVRARDTLAGAFERRVARIERTCGLLFTRHLLGYVTIGTESGGGGGGFTQCELQDLLSLDDQVAREFRCAQLMREDSNEVMRIPWYYILRALNELSAARLLTTRPCHGVYTVGWRHCVFAHLARQRYLADQPALLTHLHRNVAEYLMGTWAVPVLKPLFYDQRIVPDLNNELAAEASSTSSSKLVFDKPIVKKVRLHLARLVPSQPIMYDSVCYQTAPWLNQLSLSMYN